MTDMKEPTWTVQYLEDGQWKDYCAPQREEHLALLFYCDAKALRGKARVIKSITVEGL